MGAIYTKPGAGAQVDWSNPLARSLVTCLPLWERAGRNLYDVATGGNNGLLTWDAPWDASPYGPSLTFDGTANHWATIGSGNPANLAIGTGSPHTLACIFQVTAYSGFGIVPGLMTVQDLPFNRIATLQLYDLAAGPASAKLRCEMYDGSGGPAIQDTVDLIGTGWHSAVMTLDGSTMALYRDGGLVGTQSYSISTIDQSGTNWYLGSRPDQYGGNSINVGFKGGIALALVATRAWSADEVRAWNANPWQLFQAQIPWYMTGYSPPVAVAPPNRMHLIDPPFAPYQYAE